MGTYQKRTKKMPQDCSEEDHEEKEQDLDIKPVACFGVLTDVQYADVDDDDQDSEAEEKNIDGDITQISETTTKKKKKQKKYYRNSLNLVREAVRNWRQYEKQLQKIEEKDDDSTRLKFIIQLGDLVDRKARERAHEAQTKCIEELNKMFDDEKKKEEEKEEKNEHPKLFHIWGNHDMENFKRKDLLDSDVNTAK